MNLYTSWYQSINVKLGVYIFESILKFCINKKTKLRDIKKIYMTLFWLGTVTNLIDQVVIAQWLAWRLATKQVLGSNLGKGDNY